MRMPVSGPDTVLSNMMKRKPSTMKISRPLRRAPKDDQMATAIRSAIRQIPHGKVTTYGQVAEAAGYPRYHRQVAQVLRKWGETLPWHRVLGAGGQIKCKRDGGLEQRMRLEMEGVRFRGSRVDVTKHQHVFNSDRSVARDTEEIAPRRELTGRKQW
jgi:methylated-DNA-protein-cysteine methyltransferase-like protein